MTKSRRWLNRIIIVMLVGLSLMLLSKAWLGVHAAWQMPFEAGIVRLFASVVAGFGIGVVAALLGVAGGELLIPTIALLFGLDIKLAGGRPLTTSLPTMIVGFARYSRSSAFMVIKQEKSLFLWMAIGSIIGTGLGGMLLGQVLTRLLMVLLGVILLVSAVKTFRHAQ